MVEIFSFGGLDSERVDVWIQSGTLFVACLGLFQIWMMRRQVRADHESRRRQMSIDLMMDWEAINGNGMKYVCRKFVKELTKNQKELLIKGEPFEVPQKLTHYVEAIVCNSIHGCSYECEECCKVFKNAKSSADVERTLTLSASVVLRQAVVSYLNSFESIASAYCNNVADRDMLKEQFSFLASEEENYKAMIQDFSLTKYFPCSVKFLNDMEKFQGSQGKAPIA